eukprot:g7703.t1
MRRKVEASEADRRAAFEKELNYHGGGGGNGPRFQGCPELVEKQKREKAYADELNEKIREAETQHGFVVLPEVPRTRGVSQPPLFKLEHQRPLFKLEAWLPEYDATDDALAFDGPRTQYVWNEMPRRLWCHVCARVCWAANTGTPWDPETSVGDQNGDGGLLCPNVDGTVAAIEAHIKSGEHMKSERGSASINEKSNSANFYHGNPIPIPNRNDDAKLSTDEKKLPAPARTVSRRSSDGRFDVRKPHRPPDVLPDFEHCYDAGTWILDKDVYEVAGLLGYVGTSDGDSEEPPKKVSYHLSTYHRWSLHIGESKWIRCRVCPRGKRADAGHVASEEHKRRAGERRQSSAFQRQIALLPRNQRACPDEQRPWLMFCPEIDAEEDGDAALNPGAGADRRRWKWVLRCLLCEDGGEKKKGLAKYPEASFKDGAAPVYPFGNALADHDGDQDGHTAGPKKHDKKLKMYLEDVAATVKEMQKARKFIKEEDPDPWRLAVWEVRGRGPKIAALNESDWSVLDEERPHDMARPSSEDEDQDAQRSSGGGAAYGEHNHGEHNHGANKKSGHQFRGSSGQSELAHQEGYGGGGQAHSANWDGGGGGGWSRDQHWDREAGEHWKNDYWQRENWAPRSSEEAGGGGGEGYSSMP